MTQTQSDQQYIVKALGHGWYNFEGLDQSRRYVKIANLRCSTERRAIKLARRIIGDKQARVIIEEG